LSIIGYMTKTSISFGLVHIPVSLKLSVKPNDISFNMIDRHTKSRVKYEKTCIDCDGRMVKQEDIIRGYQYEKGQYVFFDDADFEKLKSQKDKTIAIEKFVALDQIDPIYFEKSYYVLPDKNASKAFTLLYKAMQEQGKVGIARTVVGTKENLVTLRAVDGGLVLNTMYFDDEIQSAPTIQTEKPDAKEFEMAKTIIDNMSGNFDPKDYKDEYREKVMTAIQQKIDGLEITATKQPKSAEIINLMDALRSTLESTTVKTKQKSSAG